MIGSDVVIAGLTENGTFFAEDYFLQSKQPCRQIADGSYVGVCPDVVLGQNPSYGNVVFECGYHQDGQTFFSFERPLARSTPSLTAALLSWAFPSLLALISASL
jgi:hypothetical protein